MSWIERKKLFEKYVLKSIFELSSYVFASVFLWKDFFDFEFKVIDDHLCIFAKYDLGTFLYLPPLGQGWSDKAVRECVLLLKKHNKHPGVGRIENVTESQLKHFPEDRYHRYKKGYEYCYLKSDIISLRGNTFKSQRSDYNFFQKNFRSGIYPFQDNMRKECLELYKGWAEHRRGHNKDAVFNQMLDDNFHVHGLALKNVEFLGLTGRVVVVDGKIAAYTFGYPVSKEMFCVLFEITDLSHKGLSSYIFREFCKDKELTPYRFINVMDDFELKNIQRTKMSFKPSLLLPSYGVREIDHGGVV